MAGIPGRGVTAVGDAQIGFSGYGRQSRSFHIADGGILWVLVAILDVCAGSRLECCADAG